MCTTCYFYIFNGRAAGLLLRCWVSRKRARCTRHLVGCFTLFFNWKRTSRSLHSVPRDFIWDLHVSLEVGTTMISRYNPSFTPRDDAKRGVGEYVCRTKIGLTGHGWNTLVATNKLYRTCSLAQFQAVVLVCPRSGLLSHTFFWPKRCMKSGLSCVTFFSYYKVL